MPRPDAARPTVMISYPHLPGFALLAHEVLQDLITRYGVSGTVQAAAGNCFVVRLSTALLYTHHGNDHRAIDLNAIVQEIGTHLRPLQAAGLSGTPEWSMEPDDERDYGCLCSGE